MINSCIRKFCKCLTKPVQFVIIFDTKKIAFYTSNKDKISLLSRFNTIYQVTCPGCSKSCIAKSKRCLKTRFNKHATQHDTSAIAQHFLQCQNAQNIASQNNTRQTDKALPDRLNSHLIDLILNNYKILYTNTNVNKNRLLLMEALFIKSFKPDLNNGLKASKELSLFKLTHPAQTTNPSQHSHTSTQLPSC